MEVLKALTIRRIVRTGGFSTTSLIVAPVATSVSKDPPPAKKLRSASELSLATFQPLLLIGLLPTWKPMYW